MNRLPILIVVLLFLSAFHSSAQQTNPQLEKLFASAQHKATVAGDLKGAIEDYKRIVAMASKDRAATAQALLRMAEAYQKLGDAEAQRIYERLVREYQDQKVAAQAAAGRLTTVPANTIVWSQAETDVYPGLATNARVSRDGRYITYTDWNTGNLMLRDVARGSGTALTRDASFKPASYAGPATFSPDGHRVAFAWLNGAKRRYVMRLVDSAARVEPEVLFDQEDIEWLQPYDWSRDGTRIAMQIRRLDGTGQIALLDLTSRTARVIVSFPWVAQSGQMRFSPDGRYLAFDQPSEAATFQSEQPGVSRRDVFVIPTDGTCCNRPVVQNIADETLLDWAPDRPEILFFSDRTGGWSLWSIAVAQGKASGTARLVRPNVYTANAFAPLGLTAAGDLFITTTRTEGAGISVAEVDFASGRRASPAVDVGAELANPFYGWRNYAWAPTGQTLAVYRRTAMNVGVFSFKDFATGTVRDIRARDSACAPGMVWSRDGRFLLCNGSIADPQRRGAEKAGIIRVDIETGEASFLTTGGSAIPSSDNRTIYVIRRDVGEAKESVLVRFDIASNTERELLRRPALQRLALAPDGRHIAVVSTASQSGTQSLLLYSLDGDTSRELLATSFDSLFWQPDGQAVFVRRTTPGATATFVRVTLDGRVTDHPELDLGAGVLISADGKLAAFSAPSKSTSAVVRLRAILTSPGSR